MNDDEPLFDDVLLAYQRYAPPRPEPTTPWRPTWRQRIRIRRAALKRRVHQAIHDRYTDAVCDG